MIRLAAFLLVGFNFTTSVVMFPLISLIAFFTNWCMMGSMFCVMMSAYFATIPNIDQHKTKLAALHILLEFTFLFNLVTVLVYWTIIHSTVIDTFSGMVWVHMYIVHIFPAVAYCLNARVTHFELCPDHWRLFVPFGVLYAIINYMETQRRGKPLYWFITWEDWTSPAVCLAMQIIFSLMWVVFSKLQAHRNMVPSNDKKAKDKSQ
mmetsp:Transcript_3977/g.5041  ORF Transcript_3977/g.5041 Transcript_3977/m.5041 type:complete len:206 (-) Transcript_3977:75-692(-)